MFGGNNQWLNIVWLEGVKILPQTIVPPTSEWFQIDSSWLFVTYAHRYRRKTSFHFSFTLSFFVKKLRMVENRDYNVAIWTFDLRQAIILASIHKWTVTTRPAYSSYLFSTPYRRPWRNLHGQTHKQQFIRLNILFVQINLPSCLLTIEVWRAWVGLLM